MNKQMAIKNAALRLSPADMRREDNSTIQEVEQQSGGIPDYSSTANAAIGAGVLAANASKAADVANAANAASTGASGAGAAAGAAGLGAGAGVAGAALSVANANEVFGNKESEGNVLAQTGSMALTGAQFGGIGAGVGAAAGLTVGLLGAASAVKERQRQASVQYYNNISNIEGQKAERLSSAISNMGAHIGNSLNQRSKVSL